MPGSKARIILMLIKQFQNIYGTKRGWVQSLQLVVKVCLALLCSTKISVGVGANSTKSM